MRFHLQYIADTILIESLIKEDSKIAIAQDSSASPTDSIKSYVSSIFNKDKPTISSIMSLFTDGLLFSLGGTKLKILYFVAKAFGFNFEGFWHTVGTDVAEFVKEILSSGKKADFSTTASKANEIATNAVSASFTGTLDESKIKELADKGMLKSFSIEYNSKLVKNASITSKIATVLIRIVGWLIITVLGALALSEVGKLVSNKGSEKEETAQSTGKLIQISPDAPSELFSIHRNNMSSIWIEHGNIEDIESILNDWIFSAYPQLKKYQNLLTSSPAYQSMVDKFQERNKLADGLGMISIPRPYQRKIDIISMIVGTFLRSAGASEKKPSVSNNQQRDFKNTYL
jgi:hypothetical protein